MARRSFLGPDGTVDADLVAGMRRGALIDAYEDLLADLADAKAADDGTPKARARRGAVAKEVREFHRWQRTNAPDLLLGVGATAVTAPTVATTSETRA